MALRLFGKADVWGYDQRRREGPIVYGMRRVVDLMTRQGRNSFVLRYRSIRALADFRSDLPDDKNLDLLEELPKEGWAKDWGHQNLLTDSVLLHDSDTSDSDSGEPANSVRKARSDHDSDDYPEKGSIVEEDANSDNGRLGWSWNRETTKDKAS